MASEHYEIKINDHIFLTSISGLLIDWLPHPWAQDRATDNIAKAQFGKCTLLACTQIYVIYFFLLSAFSLGALLIIFYGQHYY